MISDNTLKVCRLVEHQTHLLYVIIIDNNQGRIIKGGFELNSEI